MFPDNKGGFHMIISKKDIKQTRIAKYIGVSYNIKKINNDGTLVVNAYDEYDDGRQRLRIANAIVRFSRNLVQPTLKEGQELYGIEATAVLDTKLGKRVYVINSFSTKKIAAIV